jgi:hypothetical protein
MFAKLLGTDILQNSLYTNFIIMCHHKRFVFSCGHFSWGAQVKACELENIFLAGKWHVACETMWSHPLHSVRVHALCEDCELKRAKTAGTMTKLKLAMKELNETVGRLQKLTGEREGTGTSPVSPLVGRSD